MKTNKRGFTLIELLVVILIIGILTAIALPQYQKSVARSKLTQLTAIMDAAKKNRDMYVFAHDETGECISTPDMQELLPLELLGTCNEDGKCTHSIGTYKVDTKDIWFQGNGKTGLKFSFIIRKEGISPWQAGQVSAEDELSAQVICSWIKDNEYPVFDTASYAVCKNLGGVTLSM